MHNLIGKTIVGMYIGDTIVKGTIRDYRSRYNETIYYVDLFKPITMLLGERNSVVLKTSEVLSIS